MKLPRAHHLSPKKLAAQLLMPQITIDAIHRDDPALLNLLHFVEKFDIGGFILFGGNLFEVRYWIDRFQQTARIPLFIGADLERGVGGLFPRGTIFPHQLAWGAGAESSDIIAAANVIAEESRAIGINTIFAPVLDLVSESENPIINIRGFHCEVKKVAEFGKIFVEQLRSAGMMAVAKHFPGHGAATADSHLELPAINMSPEEMMETDMRPFREAVSAGIRGIMTGHLKIGDDHLPATFRPDILNNILRKTFNYRHLIFSDALNMGAVARHFSAIEQIKLGLSAGLDIFLMPENLPLFHSLLTDLIKTDDKYYQLACQSADRILSTKKWQHKNFSTESRAGKLHKYIGKPEARKLSQKLANQSVTCLHQSERFPLNLSSQKKSLHLIFTDFEIKETPLIDFQMKMREFFAESETVYNPAELPKFSADIICFSIYGRTFAGHQSQFEWLKIEKILSRLKSARCPVVLFIFGNPFNLNKIKNIKKFDAVFLLYSYVKSSQTAAFNALISAINIGGQLPVLLKNKFEQVKISAKTVLVNSPDKRSLPETEALIQQAVQEKVFPGASLAVCRANEIIYENGFGRFEYEDEIPKKENGQKSYGNPEVLAETQYDLASLTKVLATTPAILHLVQQQKLALSDTLNRFYPDAAAGKNGNITISDLLQHQSGLKAWLPFYESCQNKTELISRILTSEPDYPTGQSACYSDLGFILLGDIVRRISGMDLAEYCRNYFYQNMNLTSLTFNPSEKHQKLPPSGRCEFRKSIVQNEVNDMNCKFLDGIAGHAGLFGNAADVAALAQIFHNRGVYGANRYFSIELAERAISKPQNAKGSHALGWDTPSGNNSAAGTFLSKNSFGHLAFTGPSIWCDPDKKLTIVFLCNRTHPDWKNEKIKTFRPKLHDTILKELEK